MLQFSLASKIAEFRSFEELRSQLRIGKNDLLLTNGRLFEAFLSDLPCRTLLREDFDRGEPSDTGVNALLRAAHAAPFDRVFAVGGGSILDTAKILCVSDGVTDVNALYAPGTVLRRAHGLIAVPATCGTGSEVTNIAVVNRTALGTKQGLVGDALYPDVAALTPEFVSVLPWRVFSTSAIDALIHGIESFLSPNATSYSRLFSEAAIRELLRGFEAVAADPSGLPAQGMRFLSAATKAGVGFGAAGCGTVHAMSFPFGGRFHVPHGEACYQFLIPVLDYYRSCSDAPALAALDGLLRDALNADDALAALDALLNRILPAKPMSAYGATEADAADFAVSTWAHQQRLLARSVVPLSEEVLHRLFLRALE